MGKNFLPGSGIFPFWGLIDSGQKRAMFSIKSCHIWNYIYFSVAVFENRGIAKPLICRIPASGSQRRYWFWIENL